MNAWKTASLVLNVTIMVASVAVGVVNSKIQDDVVAKQVQNAIEKIK